MESETCARRKKTLLYSLTSKLGVIHFLKTLLSCAPVTMSLANSTLRQQLSVVANYLRKVGDEVILRQPSRYNSVSSLVSDLTKRWTLMSEESRRGFQSDACTDKETNTAAKKPIDSSESKISVTFIRPDGTKTSVKTSQGKTLYDAVIDNNVDIDGFGACEGTLCCTTCHLIFKQSDYEKIGEPRDEELDMLDLAYGLTDTSRLGCQVTLKKELDPLDVQVPASINDVREG